MQAQRAQAIELSNLSYHHHHQQGNGHGSGENTFLSEVCSLDLWCYDATLVLTLLLQVVSIQEDIGQFNENVRQIATLRLHSLNALDGEGQNDMSRVEELTNETRTLSQQLKDRIKMLEASPTQMDAQVRKNRVSGFCAQVTMSLMAMKLELLRKKFLDAIQNYQRVEQEGRVKVRERAERQVRIGTYSF